MASSASSAEEHAVRALAGNGRRRLSMTITARNADDTMRARCDTACRDGERQKMLAAPTSSSISRAAARDDPAAHRAAGARARVSDEVRCLYGPFYYSYRGGIFGIEERPKAPACHVHHRCRAGACAIGLKNSKMSRLTDRKHGTPTRKRARMASRH